MKLTPKQEAFAVAYVKTGNACEAYRQAYDAKGMSPAAIKANAHKLTKRTDIALTVAKLTAPAAKAAGITAERNCEHIAKAAYGEATDSLTWANKISALDKAAKISKQYDDSGPTGPTKVNVTITLVKAGGHVAVSS